jgi:hypothetical protein
MLVTKVSFPINTLFNPNENQAHYSDCYHIKLPSGKCPEVETFVRLFLSGFPLWIRGLFVLRNILVTPFGISTGVGTKLTVEEPLQKGLNMGIFNVSELTETEILLFAKDNHLDAWLLFTIAGNEPKTLTATTAVHFNNRLGRIYFFIIKPFHKLIVRQLLQNLHKTLTLKTI